jgi:hypothetical protein
MAEISVASGAGGVRCDVKEGAEEDVCAGGVGRCGAGLECACRWHRE